MVDFQRKRQIRRILYSKFTLLALLIAVLYFGKNTWELAEKAVEARRTVAILRNEKLELSAQEEMLSARVSALKTPYGVEAALREKFGVGKPGEGVVIIVDQEGAAGNTGMSPWWDGIRRFMEGFWAEE